MNLKEVTQKLHQAVDLYKKNEINQAKEIFEQLSSEIDQNIDKQHQKIYAQLQLFLGFCYEQQGKLEEAIIAYEDVPKEAQKWYAEAQTHIGGIYYQLKKLDRAIVAYRQVPSEEHESYTKAQFNITHVAQREEWTFCREKGSCEDNGWNEYKDIIDQVNASVRGLILEIKDLIHDLNSVENSDIAELIEEIVLPLRYLIKHYAFKEEQECRTIYITQWNDEKIQLDPNLKRIYVDYQNILPTMEKIFLSVGALHHESALQYLGQTATKKFTVKRSHNPFRT
ncbi:tetratricopeptide repeat protein [Acinetobacter sp. ANC 5383]